MSKGMPSTVSERQIGGVFGGEKTEIRGQASWERQAKKGFAKHYYFFAWAFELLYKMYYSTVVMCVYVCL